jgi:ubiquitin thioesterase ZRANB1
LFDHLYLGDLKPVRQYLQNGGDLGRQLTLIETNLLNRPSAFEVGYTLVHLAIRFKVSRLERSRETQKK